MSQTAGGAEVAGDPYIAAVVALLPEGWTLVSWGTEDG